MFQVPFPISASLNGVAMFAENQNSRILQSESQNTQVLWRTYFERLFDKSPFFSVFLNIIFFSSLNLMLVCEKNETSELMAQNVIELMFNSIVLLYGSDNIEEIKSLERFKREIKVSRLDFSNFSRFE